MPLISVILPVYNTENFIAEAVQSILDQTFTDFELLVINDASTDRTLEILQSFNDERLKIITNETNLKVVRSLNKGLALAKGEFIARMDADDIAYPQRFERQIHYFNANPQIDFCGTWVKIFGAENYVITYPEDHEEIKADLLFKNIIVHPSVMFRKQSFIKNNFKYEEEYINAEDYGLWVDAIDTIRFAIIAEILLKYRVHSNNVSVYSKRNAEIIQEMNYKTYKKMLERVGVEYTSNELLYHYSLGFRSIDFSGKITLKEYLEWMQKIVFTNNKTRYFNKESLRNIILNNIIFLVRRRSWPVKSYLVLIKKLLTLFSINDYIQFARFKLKVKSLTLKRLRLYNEAGTEYR